MLQENVTSGQNLLVIKTGALGDLLVSTAALMSLCQHPSIKQVALLGSQLWSEILQPSLWPKLKQIAVLQTNQQIQLYIPEQAQWVSSGPPQPLFNWERHFNAVANLRYESPRWMWNLWRLRCPVRIGSSPFGFGFLYTHKAPWLGYNPILHERDRNLQVIQAFTKASPPFLPKLREPDWNHLKCHDLSPRDYILINPTASQRFKAWPAPRFAELVQWLNYAHPKAVVRVIGSSKETAWLKEIAPDSQILQPSSLAELFSLVAGARLLVCNASSMHFIACTYETPSLVLMGASDPRQWGPLGPVGHFLRAEPEVNIRDKLAEIKGFQSLSTQRVQDEVAKLLALPPFGERQ